MTSQIRFSLLALLAALMLGLSAEAASAAEFGIEKFVAVNCSEGHEACAQTTIGPFSEPKEPTAKEAKEQGYTQAGGHVPFGITDFKVNTEGELLAGTQKPVEGKAVTHIRTDVAPGLSTAPAAVPECPFEDPKKEHEFKGKEAIPATGFYTAPTCEAASEIGENKATVFAGAAGDVPLHGKVYNLVQPEGLASEFGVALELPKPLTEAILKKAFAEHPLELPEPEKKLTEEFLEKQQYYAHTLIEGNVEWGVGVTLSRKGEVGTGIADFHDFFEIQVSPALPLVASRLVFFGNREHSGRADFITNATSCPGNNTTSLKLTDAEGTTVGKPYTTPIGLEGCKNVPFEPTFGVAPSTTQSDQPTGVTAEVGMTRFPKAEIDATELKTLVAKLPEGMTLNPASAAGLTACTPAQARIHSSVPGVGCPASSVLGTVKLEVPQLPPGSFAGNIYLGGPESGPIKGPPYIVYLDAESQRYGVSVRLKGETIPNEATGQVTTVFSENPEQPFTKAILQFKEGALAPIANPLVCGTATLLTTLTPFSEEIPAKSPSSAFVVDSNGKGGACSSPAPFTPQQSTQNQNGKGGGHTAFTFNLARGDGQQYISEVKTTLPAGLYGAIPQATQCAEPQAKQGTCPSSSQIGTATVQAGAGSQPYTFSGSVYLTGPYNGAPYGMSIAVPAVAGPFNLGTVVTRATINVDPNTARVIVASVLPRI
ncbi:MAG TPA: hypothetical protein VNZ05_02215, partial [Solirubrobacteraceae bacterium]|nr:hypothetical protein [Solirubrobacteraceae bacterium]